MPLNIDPVFHSKKQRVNESLVHLALLLCALVPVAIISGIALTLAIGTWPLLTGGASFVENALWGSFESVADQDRSVLALALATLRISFMAMLIAGPLGLALGLYLSEFASIRTRRWLLPALEILATVPTVVYGFIALWAISPVLLNSLGDDLVQPLNNVAAGVATGFLLFPLVAVLTQAAMVQIPETLRQAAFALGTSRWQVSLHIVLPAAFAGLIPAFLLAFSRALGETMIVSLVAGYGPKLTLNPFVGADTMTSYILRVSDGNLLSESPQLSGLFVIGLLLFVATLGLNSLSGYLVKQYRRKHS